MIAEHDIAQVAEFVQTRGLSEAVMTDLRNTFSGKHFTLCTEDDINTGSPVYESEQFMIYLVNSIDHCSVLTNDLDTASGFVIAEIIED